jgi:FMN phosphatase YigB (HAD superfamily)
MSRELVKEDVTAAGIAERFDVLITSRDVGLRKPSLVTLHRSAEALSCQIHDMVHVGNERKDVEVAKTCGCPSILIDRFDCG